MSSLLWHQDTGLIKGLGQFVTIIINILLNHVLNKQEVHQLN